MLSFWIECGIFVNDEPEATDEEDGDGEPLTVKTYVTDRECSCFRFITSWYFSMCMLTAN